MSFETSNSERGAWERQRAAEARAFAPHELWCPETEALAAAEQADMEADALLKVDDLGDPSRLQRGGGGEIRGELRDMRPALGSAGEAPDAIAVDASRQRLSLVKKANVLPLALDIAETVGATDSAQQILAHQIAAAHSVAMELITIGQSTMSMHHARGMNSTFLGAEAARCINLAARLFETSQRGALAISRLKTAGKQTLVVQHVHVADGGQAVVAGEIGPRKVD